MIPVDLAARLRMLTEASFFQADQPVHQLNRIREIQADPQEFTPGQRLTATIERPLPDGLFRALVAGKTVTLALQAGAHEPPVLPGQTLALEVTRNTPKALYAQIVPPQAKAEVPAALSQTGRLISVLLTGQPASEPAPLAGGKPLIAAPPASGAPLVPLLKQALTQSGMFYESHQALWIAGKLNTVALRQEPQGQVPVAPVENATTEPTRTEVVAIRGNPPPAAPGASAVAQEQPAGPVSQALDQALEFFGMEPEPSAPAEAARPAPAPGPAPAGGSIPERILPLVSQQLDALATQQFVWQGQVWPGQTMEWQIEDPTGGRREAAAEGRDWNTTLHLTLPRLGRVEAQLKLTASGVMVRLLATDPESQAALAADKDALARGLDAAHVPLLGLSVEPSNDAQ